MFPRRELRYDKTVTISSVEALSLESTKYLKPWEPDVTELKVLACGTWWYDGLVPYQIELVRRKHNYDSLELDNMYRVLTTERDDDPYGILTDYIDSSVNCDGHTFVWLVGENKSPSSSLSTYKEARDYIRKLGKHSVDWHVSI